MSELSEGLAIPVCTLICDLKSIILLNTIMGMQIIFLAIVV